MKASGSKEIWETIPDCFNYQVSTRGRVRTKARFDWSGRFRKAKVMKLHASRGYWKVVIYTDSYVRLCRSVHQLVAKTFLKNPKKHPLVNHIDSNRKNNRVENLEWCSHSHNCFHAYSHGKRVKMIGEKHPHSVLTKRNVISIKKSLEKGTTSADLARKYKVSPSAIYKIKKGESWAHV